MPKISIEITPERRNCAYPAPFHEPLIGRVKRVLGDAGGLTDFGVNLTTLVPGAWSGQRHWHTHEDEFVYVLEGALTLIDDDGETLLREGDCAAYPKGEQNGHHLVNRSGAPAVYLEIGARAHDDECHYPDIDMHHKRSDGSFTTKKGAPYPARKD